MDGFTPRDELGFDAFWAPLVHGLSDDMAGKLLKALLDYHFTGRADKKLPKTIQPLYDYMTSNIYVAAEVEE